MLDNQGKEGEELVVPGSVKIFYSSRTHSQLTQFADELRRVSFPTSENKAIRNEQDEFVEPIKYLTLGSRKNLCINPKVLNLSSNAAVNEKCLDLQSAKTPAEHKCPFFPSKESEALVDQFGDHAMAVIRDIEDLGHLGKKIGICPYYASRSAIKSSEVSVSQPSTITGLLQGTDRREGGQSTVSSTIAEVCA